MTTESLFIDLQGFKTTKTEFIVKEFAYSTKNFTQVFLIKPPYNFSTLTEDEKRRVTWVEKHLGILWREGFVDYREFKRMIYTHLVDKKIFVKGNEKVKWIKDLCDNCTVEDLGENNCSNFQSLYQKYCKDKGSYHCLHHKKSCALKNVICIKKWYFDC